MVVFLLDSKVHFDYLYSVNKILNPKTYNNDSKNDKRANLHHCKPNV